MRNFSLPVVAFAVLASLAAPSFVPAARAQSSATTSNTKKTVRVWTTDDMDALRAKGLITTFSPEVAPQPGPAQPAPTLAEASVMTPRPVSALDPDWYAQQAALLQAELDARQNALAQYVQTIQDAKSLAHTTSGIALDKDDAGVTPEAGIEVLQAQVNDVASQLDSLAEMARENGIPPGALRG